MPVIRSVEPSALRKPAFHLRPAQAIFVGFAIAIAAGTLLLMLPVSKAGPGAAGFVDALFTAVSAVCVVGLAVVDTPVFWSGFGLVVIVALVQVGGFGIMTFASVIGLAVARRLSLRSKLTAGAEVRSVGLDDVKSLLLGVVRITFAIEAIVALILTARFALGYGHPLGEAIWYGIFHSVMSFNNAGFALFSDSMMSYATDPWISLPVAAGVILGSLGFPVMLQLRKHFRRPLLWTMNTRLVLWGTALLLVSGTVYITAIEWDNPATLGPMDWPAKILAGFFASSQTRSGGFNSVDTGAMDSATWIGMDILMFIGGGPASTAGGIKITTFAVLLFIILTELRGQQAVNVFGKRLPRAVHREAITVALLSLALVAVSTVALMLMTNFDLDQLLFETISAFATVGLSTGITAALPPAGHIVLVILMFVGRLGPITLAASLALRHRPLLYELPQERPIIG